MEFLTDYKLTSAEIDEIKRSNNSDVLKNIEMNNNNVKEIIEYLLSLGITTSTLIDLFIHQVGLFFKTKDEISNAFDEYELDSIVKSLNYDVNTLDLIEFN